MQPESDAQLLREYVERGAETAFAEIVVRHTNLVYSAALRQVDSPDIAAEVAQSVFIGLARGARSLCGKLAENASLAGWLCRSARNISLNLRRDEFRRHSRERQAMENLDSMPNTTPGWEHLRPVLDEAMSELSESDYDALVMRFFKNQDLRSVGLALGVSDDTAQKRVSRALDKLRDLLSQRGVTTSAATLSIVLSANAVQAAPIGLAVTISTAAAVLAGTTLATTATATAIKTIAMTTLQKTVVTATVAVLAGVGIYESFRASRWEKQVQSLREQRPISAENEQLSRDLESSRSQLAALVLENEKLRGQVSDIFKLRGEVARLRSVSRELANPMTRDDSTEMALNSWLNRVKTLKQRFAQWRGTKTPEIELLTDEEWLEAAKRTMNSEEDWREAMSELRWTAKGRFAKLVDKALEQYAESNNEQLPSDLSQLSLYLSPPANSFLEGYEMAKPGAVTVKNKPVAWAMMSKGATARDRNLLSDKDYDLFIAIYRGGYSGFK